MLPPFPAPRLIWTPRRTNLGANSSPLLPPVFLAQWREQDAEDEYNEKAAEKKIEDGVEDDEVVLDDEGDFVPSREAEGSGSRSSSYHGHSREAAALKVTPLSSPAVKG